MIQERRQFPRYAVEVEALVLVEDEEIRARTRDLSRSGMCFVSRSEVPVGLNVVIRAALKFDANSFSEALPLPARVMWCTAVRDGYQVGVAFLRLHPQTAEYLEVFLKYLRGEIDLDGQEIPVDDTAEDDGDKFA